MRSGGRLGLPNNKRRRMSVPAQSPPADLVASQYENAHQLHKLAFWNKWIRMTKLASTGFLR